MNANPLQAPGTMMNIDAPITLRLPAGSAVFAADGEAWITQDGRPDDVILTGGQRFDVRSRAPIVISATRGHAVIYVASPAAARLSASCNVHDFVRAHSAALRRAEASRWLEALTAYAGAALQRARAVVRPLLRVHTQ